MSPNSNFSKINILFAISLFVNIGCELTDDAIEDINDAFNPPPPVIGLPGPQPTLGPLCYSESFRQPPAEITKKIDILFVTDTSGSLVEERDGIAEGIDAFIQALPLDVNYQVGVLLAHSSKSSKTGRLFQATTEPVVLSSEFLTLDEVRNDLKSKLNNVWSDYYGDGGEEMLFSLQNAINEPLLTENKSHGFFRDDAALAVVFITDENDICAEFPEGVTPVYDGDHLEAPAFDRDCGGVTPSSVLEGLKNITQDRPLLVSGIVYNDPNSIPHVGENELAYGILDIIDLGNGISVDLASGNYDNSLTEIGQLATVKLNLITERTLFQTNIDPASIVVKVNGIEVDFVYMPATNQVQLLEPGSQLARVQINYCVLPSNPEDDGGTPPEDDPPEEPVDRDQLPISERDKDGDGIDDVTGEPLY